VRALLLACFVVVVSSGIALLERPGIITAYQTVEIAAAWPPHVVATIPRVHLIPRLEQGWRPMPWPQWTDPRARARRLAEINGRSSVGQVMRTDLWVESALVALLPQERVGTAVVRGGPCGPLDAQRRARGRAVGHGARHTTIAATARSGALHPGTCGPAGRRAARAPALP